MNYNYDRYHNTGYVHIATIFVSLLLCREIISC